MNLHMKIFMNIHINNYMNIEEKIKIPNFAYNFNYSFLLNLRLAQLSPSLLILFYPTATQPHAHIPP